MRQTGWYRVKFRGEAYWEFSFYIQELDNFYRALNALHYKEDQIDEINETPINPEP